MGETIIQNFKLGLDSRRSVLTSQAGSLVTLENMHVNQGAELERRKAFVKFASMSTVDTNGDVALFGLEATDVGIVVFTHCRGSYVTEQQTKPWLTPVGQPTLATVPTAGLFIYQLMHPSLVFGGSSITYDRTIHRMTKALLSRCVGGKSYVIATFADGNSFMYYDGDLVLQSVAGRVLAGGSTQTLINQFALRNLIFALARETDWTSSVTPGSSPLSQVATRSLTIYSPVGTTFSSVPDFLSTSGKFVAYDVAGNAVTTPWTTTWNPGAGTHTVTVTANGVTYTVLNAQVFTTVAAVTLAINQVSSYTGVTASDNGTTVTFSYPWQRATFTSIPAAPTIDIDGGGSVAFTGGTGPGYGDTAQVAFYDNWATSDEWWNLTLVPSAGSTITLGYGNLDGFASPTYILNLRERPFVANGDRYNFASPVDVTGWEDQDIGAGFNPFDTQWGQLDSVQSLAPYQGMLAVLGRYSIQIWITSATVTDFSLKQTLTNIGTIAPDSTRSLGELDVIFLADSGFRSLRARDSSLNAFVNDIGSPIDATVQAVLSGLTAVEKAAVCSIVNPEDGRYWCLLDDTIYVLSYFPTIKIVAWSTYKATYTSQFQITLSGTSGQLLFHIPLASGLITADTFTFNTDLTTTATQIKNFLNSHYSVDWTVTSAANVLTLVPSVTFGPNLVDFSTEAVSGDLAAAFSLTETSFTPTKFVVYNGQVYVTDGSAIYYYGGADTNVFDNCIATVETPWLDARDKNVRKQFINVNAAIAGKWTISAGTDPYSGTLETIATTGTSATPSVATDSTFDLRDVAFTSKGTHFKMKAVSDQLNKGRSTVNALVMLSNE